MGEVVSGAETPAGHVGNDADEQESIARASLVDVFASVLLLNPTWTIIRNPFGFTRYRDNPGAAIHYLYAAIGYALLITSWMNTGEENDGGDAAPLIALINRAISGIGPHAKLDGNDVMPVMLLIGNVVGGLTAYQVGRFLARRAARKSGLPAPTVALGSQTFAATAYFGGATAIFFATGLLFSHGDENAIPSFIGGCLMIFMIYCWGLWIRRIHGIRCGIWAGILFSYSLAFVSLLVFCALILGIKAMLV